MLSLFVTKRPAFFWKLLKKLSPLKIAAEIQYRQKRNNIVRSIPLYETEVQRKKSYSVMDCTYTFDIILLFFRKLQLDGVDENILKIIQNLCGNSHEKNMRKVIGLTWG